MSDFPNALDKTTELSLVEGRIDFFPNVYRARVTGRVTAEHKKICSIDARIRRPYYYYYYYFRSRKYVTGRENALGGGLLFAILLLFFFRSSSTNRSPVDPTTSSRPGRVEKRTYTPRRHLRHTRHAPNRGAVPKNRRVSLRRAFVRPELSLVELVYANEQTTADRITISFGRP